MKMKLLHPVYENDPPKPATEGSAGIDLRACITYDVSILPGERACIPLGVSVAIPQGYVGLLFSRSGLGAKKGLTVAQGVGVIDSDYRGEVCAWMLNTSNSPIAVHRGDRVVQLICTPLASSMGWGVAIVDDLDDTERGSGGFGHTGS